MKNKTVTELKRIAKENGGVLLPETVVDEARPKSSPLHSKFQWDNSRAAHLYRIWQARQLISITVEMMEGSEETTDVFVSLTPDRLKGGYRITADVLSDEQMRAQMLSDAVEELNRVREKYQRVKELVEVWHAIKRVRRTKLAKAA